MSLLLEEEKKLFLLLSEGHTCDDGSAPSPAITETLKMLYRMNILDNAFQESLTTLQEKYLPHTMTALNYLLLVALRKANFSNCSEFVPSVSTVKKDNAFDYQFSDAFKIAKIASSCGTSISPDEVAKRIVDLLPENQLIEHVEVTGPGYVNVTLNKDYVASVAQQIAMKGVLPPAVKHRRVLVDFSSPNTAKEMHVGHLRSTIIGDSICRLFEYVGFDVLRISHIGDWGTPFGMLIAHLEDCYPSFLSNPPPISDLQRFYKESKKRFDEDEDFKKRSYSYVVKLQNGEETARSAWTHICEISSRAHQETYKRLDISLVERGESFYQSRMVSLVKELTEKNLLTHEDGCKTFHVPGIKVPLMVVKSDGGFTYDTSDMATIKQRLLEEKVDWVIYVVDSGQSDHFKTLFSFARIMGWSDPSLHRVQHIGFGVVLGEDRKKFKTRSGDTVKLTSLLDESVTRASEKLRERNTTTSFSDHEILTISEAIGYGCVRYADLSHNLVADYEFSYDRMLDNRGNTAVYLQYIYTRIRSIIRKTGKTEQEIVAHAKDHPIQAEDPQELKILRKLVHFPEVIHRIIFDTYPHYLCEYLYDLAGAATEYYDACYIVSQHEDNQNERSINMNRLAQMYVISLVLKKGFHLLGIRTLERM